MQPRHRRIDMRALMAAAVIALAGAFAACNPPATAPSPLLPPGTHQSEIAAVSGRGSGGVSVTPKPIPEGTMAVDISLLIAQAKPNTNYIVQRSPEIGRALAADGVCQRAAGVSPWSAADPPAPAFVTFPQGTSAITVTTDASGSGTRNFEFRSPTIPAGTVFDVMFRLVDDENAPTTELRSGCFTVIVK